jgi:hypothetical protein
MDLEEKYEEMMTRTWNKALPILKSLSEK